MDNESTKKVLLVIADISGYTEFMVSSELEIEHSQHIISELIKAIITQVEIPLEVSKLEGDAVFLYAIKESEDYTWDEVAHRVGKKLIRFFEAFHDRLENLGSCGICNCGACSNTGVLSLKVVVHSGHALFYRLHRFEELSGSDVILVHRLLKNSAAASEYILMTGEAYTDVAFPRHLRVEKSRETYEHLGEIDTLIYYPGRQAEMAQAGS
jgi:hypothetical protein